MPPESRHRNALIGLAFIAFVSLGLPDGVLGVAWASIRTNFGQSLGAIGQLLGAGMLGYLASSFFGGQLVRHLGVGKVLSFSSVLAAAAMAGYTLAPRWEVMVGIAVLGGLGAGAIDAGVNAFAAARFSPRIVNWLHASWGVGASIGPLLMTFLLARELGWRPGYQILAGVMALLSLLFLLTLRWWEMGGSSHGATHEASASVGEALRRPAVWAQLAIFFVYSGIESTAGQLLFTLLTESRGVGVTVAGTAVGAYWASLTAGRIVFGQLATRISRTNVLRIGMTLAPIAAALLWANVSDVVSFGAAALLGFSLAPIFPTLISATPDRVGAYYSAQSVGFQIAVASIGIAMFPGVVGTMARRAGLETICVYLLVASLALVLLHETVVRTRARRNPGA